MSGESFLLFVLLCFALFRRPSFIVFSLDTDSWMRSSATAASASHLAHKPGPHVQVCIFRQNRYRLPQSYTLTVCTETPQRLSAYHEPPYHVTIIGIQGKVRRLPPAYRRRTRCSRCASSLSRFQSQLCHKTVAKKTFAA